jgi:hypothetical protein
MSRQGASIWAGHIRAGRDSYGDLSFVLAAMGKCFSAGERAGIERACDAFDLAIIDGYPTPAHKVDQCTHGKFGWEDCIACYDEALASAIADLRALIPGANNA